MLHSIALAINTRTNCRTPVTWFIASLYGTSDASYPIATTTVFPYQLTTCESWLSISDLFLIIVWVELRARVCLITERVVAELGRNYISKSTIHWMSYFSAFRTRRYVQIDMKSYKIATCKILHWYGVHSTPGLDHMGNDMNYMRQFNVLKMRIKPDRYLSLKTEQEVNVS